MAVYASQGARTDDLRKLLEYLENEARQPNTDAAAAYNDAAKGLRKILDKPVAVMEDIMEVEQANTPDMSVTVAWPLRRGEMQTAVFDRDGGPDLNTMTRHDRVIVRTMLEQALEWFR